MVKLRKGELTFYKSMTSNEINQYVTKFPENTEYVMSFLGKYHYDWVKKLWKRGKTI